jgi:hypothetical protein
VNLLPAPRDADMSGALVEPRTPRIEHDASLPAEGYELTVSESGEITIRSADPAGEHYARQTLSQLERTGGGSVPVGRIRDWPDLPVRAVMLDISRDKVPTMATLRETVDRLASWKVNQLQLYSEHTFAYREHSVVWRDASPMSADEIRELDAYCAERHIELVPNQNCLGHMERWLAHEPYAHLAMEPGPDNANPTRARTTIEPTHPQTLPLIRSLMQELLPNFAGTRYVQVGLDEPWEMSKDRIDDYLAWVRALRSMPEIDGREMLIWGDILAGNPDWIAALPDGVTVCEWGYDAGYPFDERAATFGKCDRDFWVAPGTSSWLTILGRVTNMRANCAEAVDAALAHGGRGLLNTDWGDQGHLQYLPVSDPGLAYGAAVGWCVDSNRGIDLAAALSAHCYDDDTGVLAAALVKLGDAYLRMTPQMMNVSTATLHLYWPQLTVGKWPLSGATAGDYEAVAAVVDEVGSTLHAQRSSRPDAALVVDELRNAIALVGLLARDGIARVSGDGTLPGIPATTRARLADDLRPIIDEHERLWLARNRPGGLSDSRAWLEQLLHCYETGTVELTWGSR